MEPFELNSPVHPGAQCGPFRLGMSLHEALAVIKNRAFSSNFESKKTSVIFSKLAPTERPIVVDIQAIGTMLRFEPKEQRLVVIDVYDLSKLGVSLQDHTIGGPSLADNEAATLKTLYSVLGVTHSGFRKEEVGKDAFCLQYPGLLIAFQVPEAESFTGIPLVLSNGQSPKAVRILVHEFEFPRSNLKSPIIRSAEVTITEDQQIQLFFKELNKFSLFLHDSTCQDVLSGLGAPSKVCFKEREPIGNKVRRQMDINSRTESDDYFFNYFSLGLDILFDGIDHIVRKVILRTNLISHPLFDQYDKCCFSLKFLEKPKKPSISASTTKISKGNGSKHHQQQTVPIFPATNFEDILASTSVSKIEKTIKCDDSWMSIAKELDLQDEKPMVHERADQPFGSCYLFGYKHSVFEVDKQSQFVASVTLF